MNTKENEFATLEEVLAASWRLLASGAADRRHGFHHPVVSTVDAGGHPQSRVVVLRGADLEASTLRFHTDIRSSKWRELQVNPRINLCFYDETVRTQIRVAGQASLHTSDAISDGAWKAAQRMSRVCYGIAPGPGVMIDAADDYTLSEDDTYVASGLAHFGVVLISVLRLEWLYLRQSQNRRAIFDLVSKDRSWLVP